jgi:hypothetical protein
MQESTALRLVFYGPIDKGDGVITYKEETFPVVRRVPSAKLRADIRSIASKYQKLSIDESQKAELPEGTSDLAQFRFMKDYPDKAKASIDAKETAQSLSDRRILEMAQAIVNTDQIKDADHLAAINSDIEADFWQGQNMEEIDEFVSRFCGRNNVG